MLKNFWYAVLDSSEVKENKITSVKRLGKNLVFFRTKSSEVACLETKCAHRGADLGLGKVVDGFVQCPFHGLLYDSNGRVNLIPANGRKAKVSENFRIKSFKVQEKYGFIWLWNGEGEPNKEIPFVEDIDDSFSYATLIDEWKTNYTRCIENQLDVSHLPFVHYNTIGRGNHTLVNGPRVEVENDRIKVWVHNTIDDGKTLPLKPDQVNKDEAAVHLEFVFPNIWQNYISKSFRVFAAFVPTDEERTLVYVRSYSNFLKPKALGRALLKIGNQFNKIVLHQDRHVVLTQVPKKTSLKMDENLFQADLPIIEFRKMRERFLEEG